MKVVHSQGTYDIDFCSLEHALGRLPDRCVIVTDDQVHAAYTEALAGRKVFTVPAGESSKSMAQATALLERLGEARVRRSDSIVAFGGGVVGDLAGFVAATYMRGVPFIQMPTSLLAMVDSSVGGKVGVDLAAGKNMAGAFYPPKHIFVCSEALNTLPNRHFVNGMAEVWKAGYILDRELLDTLQREPLTVDHPLLLLVIRRCIEIKREVVQNDEFETKGERAKLNFGHTIGHAIEKCLNYEELLHGEAIAIGMVLEAKLGENLGITPAGTSDTIASDMAEQGLPTALPAGLNADALIEAMASDKKVTGNALAFSLLTSLGTCKLFTDVEPAAVRAMFSRL